MPAVFETAGAVTASSRGTAVIADANAKGSWTELIASTSITTKLLYVFFRASTDPAPYVIDIGTGAAASEVVVISNLLIDTAGPAGSGQEAGCLGPFRIDIASGTRIAARAETNAVVAGDETIFIEVLLCDSEIPLLTSPTHASYGVTVGSTPKGNTVDPGGTAHTKGAYTELVAASAASIEHLMLKFGSKENLAAANADFLVDIATGAPGSEAVIVANLHLFIGAITDRPDPQSIVIPGNPFAGVRIAARAQCSIIDATDRLISVSALATSGTVKTGARARSFVGVM